MPAATGKKSVAEILKAAQKKYDIKIGSASDVLDTNVASISTGSMAINSAVGVGGIPRGRTAEFYGLPASGKTTCAIETAANEQKRIIADGTEEYILYLDYEQSLDPKFVKGLGLDMSHRSFLLAQPTTFEEGAEIAKDLISSGAVRLAIWDSVAAMVPKSVWESEEGKANIAPLARVFGPFLQKLNSLLKENDCSAIFINHLKEKIDGSSRPSYMGPAETTPGGVALKFFCSLRLKFQETTSKRADIVDVYGQTQKVKISTDVKVTVTKNKVGDPHKMALVRIRYGRGFEDAWSALKAAEAQKKLYGSAGYYYFDRVPELIHEEMPVSGGGKPYLRTEEGVLEFADSHPEWRAAFIEYGRKLVAEYGSDSLVVDSDEVDEDDDDEVRSTGSRVAFEKE